jgi:hypothetical protein
MFTNAISLDNATRLWDVVVFEGDAILVRAAVALVTHLESKLFGAKSNEEVLGVLRAGVEDWNEEDWIAAVRGAGKSSAS